MYILHIETSTKVCSVAISRNDQLIAWEDKADQMNHAALLAPMVAGILEKCSLSPRDLGAVSISSGPGSYTGLRVGSSTAKSIAYSLQIPLIAVPTLEALSIAGLDHHPGASHALPMIDARRDEVYASLFNRDNTIVWPDHAVQVNRQFILDKLTGLQKVICCGDGSFKLKPYISEFPNLVLQETLLCSARHLIKPVWARWSAAKTEDPLHFIPLYLKPPNITQPRKTA